MANWWDNLNPLTAVNRATHFVSHGFDGRSEDEINKDKARFGGNEIAYQASRAGNAGADVAFRSLPGMSTVYNAASAVKGLGGGQVDQALRGVIPAYDVASSLHDATQGKMDWQGAGTKAAGFAAGTLGGAAMGLAMGGSPAQVAGGAVGGGATGKVVGDQFAGQNSKPYEQIRVEAAGGTGAPGGHQQQLIDIERQKFQQQQDLANKMLSVANPHDTNSEAWKRHLAQSVNRTNASMKGAEHRAQVNLAGRGMMGSGQESAAMGNIAAARSAAVSDTENTLYSDALKGASAFEMDKIRKASNALGASDYSNVLKTLADRDYNAGQADEASKAALIQTLISKGIELSPEILKAFGVQ